jgi:hypothetical protein
VIIFLTFQVSVSQASEQVVFDRTQRKPLMSVVSGWSFYQIGGKGGVAVIIDDSDSPKCCYPQTPLGPSQFTQPYEIPNLIFDKSVGKRGAIVFVDGATSVVCATRTFWKYKPTGLCTVEVTETSQNVRLRLIVK